MVKVNNQSNALKETWNIYERHISVQSENIDTSAYQNNIIYLVITSSFLYKWNFFQIAIYYLVLDNIQLDSFILYYIDQFNVNIHK